MSAIVVHHFAPRYGATPRLAEVEAEEVTVEGQQMWAVRRPGAQPDEGALVSGEGIAIAVFFDGTRDLRAVQKAVYERYGQLLYIERIHELASALGRANLLEAGTGLRSEETTAAPPSGDVVIPNPDLRPAIHAGNAYEADPEKLRAVLDGYFSAAGGPGAEPLPVAEPHGLLGLVVPHIDLHRGGPAYAHAYKALAERSDADLFVVFGTAHVSPEETFTLTRRDYDTPFGAVPTDPDALAILAHELGDSIFRDENVHNEEHSIEFQALYLRYLFPEKPISMLPVLCSSLYGVAQAGRRPAEEPEVERFLAALRLATAGRRVCYVAAADLSHIGRLYGDDHAPSSEELRRIEQQDLESLSRVEVGDADGFFDHVVPDVNTRRICGLTPIYMMMRATGGLPGKLVKYAQWFGPEEESAVTYAVATVDQP